MEKECFDRRKQWGWSNSDVKAEEFNLKNDEAAVAEENIILAEESVALTEGNNHAEVIQKGII